MFFSLFVGMIYFDLDESLSTGIQNRLVCKEIIMNCSIYDF